MKDKPKPEWLARLHERQWRFVRIPIGVFFVLGGLLGFLPIVGFWMVPLGLALLASDIPAAGRLLAALQRAYEALMLKLHNSKNR